MEDDIMQQEPQNEGNDSFLDGWEETNSGQEEASPGGGGGKQAGVQEEGQSAEGGEPGGSGQPVDGSGGEKAPPVGGNSRHLGGTAQPESGGSGEEGLPPDGGGQGEGQQENGQQPSPQDQVEVHYTGTLLDGTKFDSSVDRGVPATFGVTQVIPGWVEALQLMKEGSKWRLFIPSNLAYGPAGTPGGPIGPNQTLLFDVELLKVYKK